MRSRRVPVKRRVYDLPLSPEKQTAVAQATTNGRRDTTALDAPIESQSVPEIQAWQGVPSRPSQWLPPPSAPLKEVSGGHGHRGGVQHPVVMTAPQTQQYSVGQPLRTLSASGLSGGYPIMQGASNLMGGGVSHPMGSMSGIGPGFADGVEIEAGSWGDALQTDTSFGWQPDLSAPGASNLLTPMPSAESLGDSFGAASGSVWPPMAASVCPSSLNGQTGDFPNNVGRSASVRPPDSGFSPSVVRSVGIPSAAAVTADAASMQTGMQSAAIRTLQQCQQQQSQQPRPQQDDFMTFLGSGPGG